MIKNKKRWEIQQVKVFKKRWEINQVKVFKNKKWWEANKLKCSGRGGKSNKLI